jgi:hypothetical protein
MALSVISAVLSAMVASTFCALLVLPAAGPLKDAASASHRGVPFNLADAPFFIGLTVFLIILCRDARGEYVRRS